MATQSYKNRTTKTKLLHGCHKRANRFGVEITITQDDFDIPERCPLLDIPLIPNKGGKHHANSPTIDRIIPSLGYIPGNVWVISHRANALKGQLATPEEILQKAKQAEEQLEEKIKLIQEKREMERRAKVIVVDLQTIASNINRFPKTRTGRVAFSPPSPFGKT